MSNELFRDRTKRRLLAYGLRCGLPYGLLRWTNRCLDTIAHPLDTWRRKQEASRLLKGSDWADTVSRDKAWRAFGPGELPGVGPIIEAGREIFERKSKEGLPDRGGNPFHMLCAPEDLARHPEMIEAALSSPLVDIATSYFGSVPKLAYMDVWVSRPNVEDTPFHSQRYHLDKMDVGILTLFIMLKDCGEEDGPFVLLPADISRDVCRATGYASISALGDGRLDDEAVAANSRPEDLLTITGKAGAVAIVDPTVCLHYGSRCSTGERVVAVVRYMKAHRSRLTMAHIVDKARFANKPLADLLIAE